MDLNLYKTLRVVMPCRRKAQGVVVLLKRTFRERADAAKPFLRSTLVRQISLRAVLHHIHEQPHDQPCMRPERDLVISLGKDDSTAASSLCSS